MGKVKRNLLMSVLLLVVMGIFAVLTIFVVVDAVNKKYYEDLNVDYEVQEEAPNIILTFARHEGSEVNNTTTKVVLNEEKDKFRLDGVVPEVTDGTVTNLDAITNENGGEFYFFSTNPAFIDVQETPEDPNLIFSETDIRYYISTEENPIWYDVPTENVFTLYSVFLTPNVHNADFASAPLLNTGADVIISHDVVSVPYNAFGDLQGVMMGSGDPVVAQIESVVLPNSVKSIESNFSYVELLLGELSGMMGDEASLENLKLGGAFMGCETMADGVTAISVAPGLGLGATSELSLYKEILDVYSKLHFIEKDGSYNLKTVVSYTTKILFKHGLRDSNDIQKCADVWVYPIEYFCPVSVKDGKLRITDNTRSIHHYSQSWQSPVRKYGRKILLAIGGSRLKDLCKIIFRIK